MSNFTKLINGETPVLVDFFAEWCGPCKQLAPQLVQAAKILGDDVKVIKIDIDKNKYAADLYRIQAVPTLVLFKKGKVVWRKSGGMYAKELVQTVKKELSI